MEFLNGLKAKALDALVYPNTCSITMAKKSDKHDL